MVIAAAEEDVAGVGRTERTEYALGKGLGAMPRSQHFKVRGRSYR